MIMHRCYRWPQFFFCVLFLRVARLLGVGQEFYHPAQWGCGQASSWTASSIYLLIFHVFKMELMRSNQRQSQRLPLASPLISVLWHFLCLLGVASDDVQMALSRHRLRILEFLHCSRRNYPTSHMTFECPIRHTCRWNSFFFFNKIIWTWIWSYINKKLGLFDMV